MQDRRAHRRPTLKLCGFCAAARRERDFVEALDQGDIELRLFSVAPQRQLGEDLALARRDVVWGQTIEREDEDVAPAGVAPAEFGKCVAQALVLPLHDFQGDVRYCHASPPVPLSTMWRGGTAVTAVNVEPVVPVNRTRRYVPIHSAGPSSSAILFVRVRDCSAAPRFAGPST